MGRAARAQGRDHTLAALKSIRAVGPGGYRLFVILDNLSANKTPAIRHWAKRANVELCFTPTNASWANPIEPQFGPVRTFVLGGSDYRNHTVLARKLQDYLRWRNAPTPMSWPPSAANAPASAANASNAGDAPSRAPGPHDQPGRCPSAAHQPRRRVNSQRVCLS